MASSGKKRDFEAPPSTGVGLYSGTVNPGHPNLYNTTMRVQVVMNTDCDFKRVRWPKIRISVYKGEKKKIFKNLNLSLITSKVLFKTVTYPSGIARKSYHKKVSACQQLAPVVVKTDFFFFLKKSITLPLNTKCRPFQWPNQETSQNYTE